MLNIGKIVLAGVAAYAAYRLSRMSAQQKQDLANNIKDQGKKILGKFMPEKGSSATGQQFGEGSQYTA